MFIFPACFITSQNSRWDLLLPYPGLRRFPNGTLKTKMLRAYHHRALAIGVPFVLNGLFEDTIFLQCAMSYCHWRCLLQDHEFVMDRQSKSSAMRHMTSLKEVHDAGHDLQSYMNAILQDLRESDDIEICGNYTFDIIAFITH